MFLTDRELEGPVCETMRKTDKTVARTENIY